MFYVEYNITSEYYRTGIIKHTEVAWLTVITLVYTNNKTKQLN